ncbi:MAG: homogentisate 1,2-dioxygenase [Bacteroidetes bacterium]|nr:homogentisate 1,2-dioxygenase [Bacteroidota bacterium]
MYLKRGNIPHKRHTVFKDSEGAHYYEQLFGTEGFDGKASLLYHIERPTQITSIGKPVKIAPEAAVDYNISPRKLEGFNVESKDDFLDSRTILMFNQHVNIAMAMPKKTMSDYFYKNGDADELFFIHKGHGVMHTLFGDLKFVEGDYLVIPRGTIYQVEFATQDNKILIVESPDEIWFPKRYLNRFGQLMEHSPFCERDLKMPEFVEPKKETGSFEIKVRKEGMLHSVEYKTHPFDVVGWDGFHYPFGLSIHDFEPLTGRVHQPPPIHQTFGAKSYVICSFVPRLYDYHPEAIPAPYNHSNIDSEEVLYYVDGDFMSRKGIQPGQFTLHPGGIAHGPHPGTMEKSIGEKETGELAVMVDTFHPLKLTKAALDIEDGSYIRSWLD